MNYFNRTNSSCEEQEQVQFKQGWQNEVDNMNSVKLAEMGG